eukprot:CAMPEP_0119261814 /NCGR_PEP_ID=MMETSP1329-20130426/1742_1 /TAXON_ID=114041 /ORGANISM="Genus nov. species nov., Strain RCC1024" /LENGTH=309 /DNA_ID=CAMNT_0007261399 /DNA_START=214 /DNA_END=1139 /DNA_ORIENTATION=-
MMHFALFGARCAALRAPAGAAALRLAATEAVRTPRWLLIDGTNLIYRSFYGMPELTRKDKPVGATLGVANSMLKVALPYALDGANIVFCLDPRTKGSWRADLSPAYKATRTRAPPELRAQLADAEAAARAFGCALARVEGHEADDVIATLARAHAAEGVDVWTGDKDLLQLTAYDGVRVLDGKGAPVDARRKFGVDGARVGDYLALVGDASDNIAGVSGVGPKSAVALLTAFGDLEAILANAATSDAVPKRARSAIAACDRDAVLLDRRLVGLNEDVALPELDFAPFSWESLLALADRFDLHAFRSRVL